MNWINNQKGSTLIENLISVFLLALFTVMVCTALLAGMNALARACAENERLYDVYTKIEDTIYGDVSAGTALADGISQQTGGSISYTIVGGDQAGKTGTIEGDYIYDAEHNKLGEFFRTDGAATE